MPIGEPLTDQQLLTIASKRADTQGSLTFLVRHPTHVQGNYEDEVEREVGDLDASVRMCCS